MEKEELRANLAFIREAEGLKRVFRTAWTVTGQRESLPAAAVAEFQAHWEEYTEGESAEARLVKTLDKAETILQHNQGGQSAGF